MMNWPRLCGDLARAHGDPVLSGIIRSRPEDFVVKEELGFEPDEKGEHLYICLEKRDMTTFQAQHHLAEHYSVPLHKVSFSGMKDRNAVTSQWFSIQHPGAAEELPVFNDPRMRCLRIVRNSRKLRRGSHKGNHFRISITQTRGDMDSVQSRLTCLSREGVPNYFGPQRFGPQARNMASLHAWFSGTGPVPQRESRSMLLSAARSFLFNRLLNERVAEQCWNKAIPGDCMALEGTGAVFAASRASQEELTRRLQDMDIHPTGFMFGEGNSNCTETCTDKESSIAAAFPVITAGLCREGLQMQRRPLRLPVRSLESTVEGKSLILQFFLGRGGYATAMLRELLAGESA